MNDCCYQKIVPIKKKLTLPTNRHPNCDGTSWGWIEGCSRNICWSNSHVFNFKEAQKFVEEYNSR